MDKNYYAIGYKPQQQSFGQSFLYDGEHDFEYWKQQNPGAKFEDHWAIRDNFVHNNRQIAERLNYPIKDVASFLSTSNSRDARIAQTIAANEVWGKVKSIAESDGSVIIFDTETIGDAERRYFHKIGDTLQNYDGYAGITEMGFSIRNFANGEPVNTDRSITIAVALDDSQLNTARKALTLYKEKGISALDDAQVRMLSWFSQYGNGKSYSYFRTEAIDFLGNQTFVTINTAQMMHPDIYNFDAIQRGITNWTEVMNNSQMSKYMSKKHVLGHSAAYIQANLNNPNTALMASNVGYDVTVLNHELKGIGVFSFDAQQVYDNTADIVYANEAIANAHGISVYKMQSRTGNKITTVDRPASQQASQEAAGLIGYERHIAGEDASDAGKIGTNKRFVDGRAYYDEVLEANKINIAKGNPYSENYYVFNRGFLDKNSMDHAIVDGKETQSYSYRNKYLSIDLENSGYVPFAPMAEDGVSVQPKDVYILSMTDENGNIIRKQFASEQMAFRYVDENAMPTPKRFAKQKAAQRAYQDEIADIDLARREYDRLMNPSDIRTNKGQEVNGFLGMQKYLNLVDEVDAKGLDGISEETWNSYGIKTSTQKRTFNALYTRLESEKDALKQVIGYIDDNMPSANNTQKTMALNKIMGAYRQEIQNLGYMQAIPSQGNLILEDALGIDVRVGSEYIRINGSNEQTIQNGLNRIFKTSSKQDILDSLSDLRTRGVLDENVFKRMAKNIYKNTTPRDSYYSTVFRDIAIELSTVMEPITSYKNGPISFFNHINDQEHVQPLLHKTVRSINDEIQQYRETLYYVPGQRGSMISLSSIAQTNLFTDRVADEARQIVESVQQISFISKKGERNKLLAELGNELGYSHEQKKLLVQFFEGREKDGSYKPYAIDGYKNLHTFIIPPSQNNSGSGFLLIANDSTQAAVNQVLFDSQDAIQHAQMRKDIEKIVGDKATIIELKEFSKVNLGSFDEYGLPRELTEFMFGDINANVTTVKQGKSAQKFMAPIIDAYEYDGKINLDIKHPGDVLVESNRKIGHKVLEYASAGEFEKGTRAAYQTANEYLRELSSPSSGRAYKNAQGQLERAINYNLNDLSHAFYIDGSGIRKLVELEAKKAVADEMLDSPIYKIVEAMSIASGNSQPNEPLSFSVIDKTFKSSEWNEFYVKNLFTGKVAKDQVFAEQITRFGIQDEIGAFDKNLFTIAYDFATQNPSYVSEQSLESLQRIQEVSPYFSQLLSETSVSKDIWTLLKPGDIVNLGSINATLRPTYIQMLNALKFNPSEISYLPNGTVMGGVSRTAIEQAILDNIQMMAPSGLPYNTQERLISTTFKQMNDAELQLRYRELSGQIDEIAAKSNLDAHKLREAFNIFTSEHMSLHEGKMFGAPQLHNQFPFMSPDVKKVSIPQLAHLQGDAQEQTIKQLREYEGKVINRGDVIGYSNGKSIYWNDTATRLTSDNIAELLTEGETRVVPHGRMVSDTKWMIQQEKATVHFTIIDDIFLKKNPIFENSQKQAMQYMQKIFDLVAGYDGVSEYQPAFLGNVSSFKHGTNLATDSIFSVIVNEYRNAGKLNQLAKSLNAMEGFEGWNFTVRNNRLISNQMNKSGMVNAIHNLYDVIKANEVGYGLSSEVNAKIIDTLQYMQDNGLVHLEAQRTNVNEIMGSSVTMDERMQQAIRLRAVSDGTYYIGEHEIEIGGIKKKVQAVDGILDGVNGVVENGVGKSWDDLYLDELKRDISRGAYDTMNTSEFGNNSGLRAILEEISKDKQSSFAMHRKAVKEQEGIVGGIKEAVLHYGGHFDIDSHDVVRVDMNDLLKHLPQNSGISSDDLQDFIFKVNGKPSNYLLDATRGVVNNKTSIYLDFGTVIGGKKGILLPLLNVDATGEDIFFNRAQSSIVRFFNLYKENIGLVDGKDTIASAMDNLFNSFARELVVFDKDSLAYKTMGKIVLPNSSQSLAQDEVAPLVDALMDDTFIRDSIKQEKEYRRRIANGETDYVDKLDTLLAERKKRINEVADVIESGEILDDSYYKLSGLSTVGRAEKGYADYIVSADGVSKPIRYSGQALEEGQMIRRFFTNSFDTSIENFRAHGLDTRIVSLQLLNDFTQNGALTKYESNKAFDAFMSTLDKAKIAEELQKVVDEEALETVIDKNNIIKSINEYVIDIRTLNEEIVNGRNAIKKADTKAFDRILGVLDSFGIAETYLSEVGLMSREMNRYPIFKSQNIARIFLNKDMRGQEIRANNPVTSIVTNVDHDGDMYMSSLDLNGGGIKTVTQQAKLIATYENSLPSNNKMLAGLLRDADAFVSDDITDINLFRLKELEKFDPGAYEDAMQKWIEINNIHSSVNDLTEGQILLAAHSTELRPAYEAFDAVSNRLTNEDIIKASLVAKARKSNIGSISTPNYKLRDTLMSIYKNTSFQDVDRAKAFEILQNLTDLSGTRLLDITEQKSIDVKHIYDAVNIAETPKWTKGMSALFNKKNNAHVSQEGLYLMMEAVNNSTFKFDTKTRLRDIHQEILDNSMSVFKRELDEAITNGNKDLAILAQFKLEFRALYEAKDLPNAQAIHKSVFRDKYVTAKAMADALATLDTDMLKVDKGSVLSDFYSAYLKHFSDTNLLINDSNVYFKSGDIVDGNTLFNRAFILESATNSSVVLRNVDLDTLRPTKYTKTISGRNYHDVNQQLKAFLDDVDGVNKYVYANSSTVRNTIEQGAKVNKFNRTLNAILFNTGYKDKNSFDAFSKFINLKPFEQMVFGQATYDSLGAVIGTTKTISEARELIEDFRWAKSEGYIDTSLSVSITQLNKEIAAHPERFKRPDGLGIQDYDIILRSYFTDASNNIFASEDLLQQVRQKRLNLKGFDNDTFTKNIDFLNHNAYDIIGTEESLNASYDSLAKLNNAFAGKDVPVELQGALTSRQSTVNRILDITKQHNQSVINQVQQDVYRLFQDNNFEQQMTLKFNWSASRGTSVVGFGEYLGTSFQQLKQVDVNRILATDISDDALKSVSVKQAYATKKTVELLKKYVSTANVPKGTILTNRAIIKEAGDIVKTQEKLYFNIYNQLSEQSKRKVAENVKKKTLSGSVFSSAKEAISKIPMKAVGITIGAMAAIGVANNLLHNQKNQSPLTPARMPNGNGTPDINGNYPEYTPQQAPMSKKKVIYHDKQSGFNFKVSAQTRKHIDDMNNAKLIGMTGGGNPSVYTQSDTSGVTDNWLANKFAELT